ncbi:ABC transporter ATP-binding protein [Actinomadura craniellae]|uniref:ABC transporter ATP-binding protein n=1 Tax=Actinomadura craniellae TaxID=2231787 RepID=A0A365H424_9ACTN|nr:ABC transporter ATP-binding protein [Actinomadura craniellae]RAY13799.1 ABC transporter ATP-binding protein [Actinomadura craniellae]
MTAAVTLEGVCRTYESPAGPVDALSEVNLSVAAGEIVAIIGPSGSGKSTLLNTLGLLDRPTSGRYLLGGQDTARLSEAERTRVRAHRIGFVFQAFHLIGHKTAVANVALPLLYNRGPRRERHRIARETLHRVGLGHRLHAVPRTLSGGEKQRVAIARAIVHRPLLLLCDEPTGNLDTEMSGTVMAMLADLAHDGGPAVVVVTHDLAIAGAADRVLRVRDGRLGEVTDRQALAERPPHG